MVAMLPGTAAAALAAVGVAATTGPWAAVRHTLNPVAEPLLIASVLLLIGATLRCGRGPAALVTLGGMTLFASMYLFTRPQPGGMVGMSGSAPMAQTNAPLFYAGVAFVAATFVWSALRRRRRTCQPAWRRTPSPA
jgi:hypothetical protein